MYLREVTYHFKQRIKRLVAPFHKSHVENLAMLAIGIAYSRNVALPRAAGAVPFRDIQVESRVARFERLLQCKKFDVLQTLQPLARSVLSHLSREQGSRLTIILDRSMINDTLNLLWVGVAYEGRALPLGWIDVGHEGNSNLEQQQRLLGWLREAIAPGVEVTLIADREFHSIHLASWLARELGWFFILRIKAGTWVEVRGRWAKAGELARKGRLISYPEVKVTRDRRADYRARLVTWWKKDQDEAWLLLTNISHDPAVIQAYGRRFWIEEMFSDHKKRGFQLESSRLTDPLRLQRLLVAVTIAYLWVMEVGAFVLRSGQWRMVDNRGARRSISLLQIGLRWLSQCSMQGLLPPRFTCRFIPLGGT